MGKRADLRHEVWVSLKIGAGVVLILLMAQLIMASLPESWLASIVKGCLYPGFTTGSRLLGVTDDASYGTLYGALALLGVSLDIAMYSGAVLLFRCLAGGFHERYGAEESGEPAVAVRRKPLARIALRSMKFGYLIAFGSFLALAPVADRIPSWVSGLLFAGGAGAYRIFFGTPSHGLGGAIWLIAATVLNGAIYSAVLFAGEMTVVAWKHRSRSARVESLRLR